MHNLTIREDGQAIFASTQDEWHGLGEKADRAMTVADALGRTGLDRIRLEEAPIFSEHGSVASHKAIYRTGDGAPKLVGVVGKDRLTTQPVDMLSPMDVLADAADGSIETVGMLGKGAVWFATVRFPGTWTINGDAYQGYLFGRDSADGSSALDIRPTLIRVVCQNTFNCALSQGRGMPRYTVRHTSRAVISAQAAREAIGMVPAYAEEFEAAVAALYAQEFTAAEFRRLTDSIFGTPDPKAKTTRSQTLFRKRSEEMSRLWRADTQDSTYRRGGPTKLTAFQAISEYLDHSYGSDKGRIDRQVSGDTARIKTQVLAALS